MSIAILAVARLMPIPVVADDQNPSARSTAETSALDDARAVEQLRSVIQTHLRNQKIDEALRALNDALAESPRNDAIRVEAIDLYLSLAKIWMGQEHFHAADRALVAVLQLQRDNPSAMRLRNIIADARQRLPAQLDLTQKWLAVEWFEPAFNSLRQARGLVERPDSSIDNAFRAAAIGAGDDNYFTKNFHRAFYFYDAALQIDGADQRPAAALVSRWLQSLVHALADDTDQKNYGESFWRLTVAKAERYSRPYADLAPLLVVLRGLAFEAAGDKQAAAQHYARLANTPSAPINLSNQRQAAVHSIRSFYNRNLSMRRAGAWQNGQRTAFAALETQLFRIHHTDATIRKQIATALDFHLERIVELAGWHLAELIWPQRIDVYVYPSEAVFRQVTEKPPHVMAISHIRRDGNEIPQWSIHARADDPLLLSSSLPHELCHLLIEANAGAATIPGAFAEGLALHVEPPCRHRQFARLFRAQSQPASLNELIQIRGPHPTAADFYAQSYRLVAVLRERIEFSEIVASFADGESTAKLARRAGYPNQLALQRRYLRILSELPE